MDVKRVICSYSKVCVKRSLPERLKIIFQDQLSLNVGQKGEHSEILSTFIKLSFVIKIFVLSFLIGCCRRF